MNHLISPELDTPKGGINDLEVELDFDGDSYSIGELTWTSWEGASEDGVPHKGCLAQFCSSTGLEEAQLRELIDESLFAKWERWEESRLDRR